MGSTAESHSYSATLRVHSQTLTASDLVARLGEPSDSHSAGDPVSRRNPDGQKRQDSQWSLDSDPDESLDSQITSLVEFAEGHRHALEELAGDIEIDIFCGVFSGEGAQGGFTLEADLLRRLAALRLDVTFDVY